MFRCADDASERGEDLTGSASQADRFVLVEFPTPWPKKPIEVFGDELGRALAGAASAAKAKVLLIRRHGQRTGDVRRWAVADARSQRIRWGSWQDQSELAALVDAVGAETSDWSRDPVILVCTHALYDACCGVRGRPVAAALTESHGDAVWESSHVGGHRFAGNVVLPLDGAYYGRLGAHNAAAVVEAHLGGTVSADHLRGFSWMPPVAQAAAVDVLRRWGPASATDFTSVTAEPLGEGRWTVEIAGSGRLPSRVTAEVEVTQGPPARQSCSADPVPADVFTVLRREAR